MCVFRWTVCAFTRGSLLSTTTQSNIMGDNTTLKVCYLLFTLLSPLLSLTHSHSLSLPPSFPPSFPPSLSLLFLLRYEMEAHYQVTDMKVMRLRSQETLSGRKEFIVVGTMATFGEEVSTKGKVCNYALL